MAQVPQVGDTFELLRTCDRYRPTYYAAASGDFNPIHIDPEVGKAAGLGGVILQGLCTLAWATDALARHVGDPGKIRRIHVRFSRPVALEDTLTFSGKIVSVENGVARAELTAKNQKGEDVLKGATAEAVVD